MVHKTIRSFDNLPVLWLLVLWISLSNAFLSSMNPRTWIKPWFRPWGSAAAMTFQEPVPPLYPNATAATESARELSSDQTAVSERYSIPTSRPRPAGPAMRNKAFRLRVRPDLAARVVSGFPWMNHMDWLHRDKIEIPF